MKLTYSYIRFILMLLLVVLGYGVEAQQTVKKKATPGQLTKAKYITKAIKDKSVKRRKDNGNLSTATNDEPVM